LHVFSHLFVREDCRQDHRSTRVFASRLGGPIKQSVAARLKHERGNNSATAKVIPHLKRSFGKPTLRASIFERINHLPRPRL
jgi:hypothetical protein